MSSNSNLTTIDAPLWDTSENHGPVVSVITWFLITTSFLAVLARIATRYAVVRQLRSDDITILAALIFSIGESIATSLQAANGLGRHLKSISSSDLVLFQKSTYASGFLYIAALSLIKLSICLYLSTLTPVRFYKNIILGLVVLIGLWTVSCIFVIGFECQLPQAWGFIEGKCIDLAGFWTYANAINVATDVALIALPWSILSKLQVTTRRKMVIIGCFATRTLVVALSIVQIYYIHSKWSGSADPTFDLWLVVLVTQLVQCLSIITACVPYLKPLLEALETGMIRASAGSSGQSYGIGSVNRFKKYGLTSRLASKPNNRSQSSGVRMDNLGYTGGAKLGDPPHNRQTVTVSARNGAGDSDGDSQTSESKIIKKTVGWSVTSDEGTIQLPANTHLEYPSNGHDHSYARAI